MGIDIYLRHKDMPKAEIEKQYTGWSIEAGDRGYLREAYHGEPYATRILVPEAFEDREQPDDLTEEQETWFGYVHIPAATLRERVAEALKATGQRYRGDPEAIRMASKSILDFVALAERWEAEGKEPLIYASW